MFMHLSYQRESICDHDLILGFILAGIPRFKCLGQRVSRDFPFGPSPALQWA